MVDSVPIVLKTGTLTHNQMKIFLDTADTDIIEKYFSTGLVDGVTTNPTLIMKSGRNPEDVYQKIKDIEDDLRKNGRSLIMDKIQAEKKLSSCQCATKNPKGK